MTGGYYWFPAPDTDSVTWHVLTCHEAQLDMINGNLALFQAALPTKGLARFATLTWNHLLTSIAEPPQWLVEYFRLRGYIV